MSASVGLGLTASSAAAAMIWPLWQKPHCTTSSSIQARCTADRASPCASRSMVVTARPCTAPAGSTHERVALPSRWTVQAPHWAMPQPYFVPVRPRTSRRTHKRGMSSGAATSRSSPLTLSFMASSRECRCRRKYTQVVEGVVTGPPARGTDVGRYLVLGKLGKGGLGIVLSAYDPQLDRRVAIKLLHGRGGGDEARARMLREARALARVLHPNIVTVYDAGFHADGLFIVMEL